MNSRLPASAHSERRWRIHGLVPDFSLEDVWLLPGEATPAGFRGFVEAFGRPFPPPDAPAALRGLVALRWKVGRIFGWDDDGEGIGSRVRTLRHRAEQEPGLTEGLPVFHDSAMLRPVYLTDNEFAAEMANATVHAVLHLGLVQEGATHRVQMAVLVRPNGIAGRLYMLAIKPFRLYLVYPALLRELGDDLAAAVRQAEGPGRRSDQTAVAQT